MRCQLPLRLRHFPWPCRCRPLLQQCSQEELSLLLVKQRPLLWLDWRHWGGGWQPLPHAVAAAAEAQEAHRGLQAEAQRAMSVCAHGVQGNLGVAAARSGQKQARSGAHGHTRTKTRGPLLCKKGMRSCVCVCFICTSQGEYACKSQSEYACECAFARECATRPNATECHTCECAQEAVQQPHARQASPVVAI